MNRRGFLKGFTAITGTLAIAPAFTLAPVNTLPIQPDISLLITQIKGDITPLDTLLRDFRERRNASIDYNAGFEWNIK